MTKKSIYILIILAWSLGPFLWQIYSSFSTPESIVGGFSLTNHKWTIENYVQIFLDLEKRPQFNLENALSIRSDSAYSGTGIDAPSLVSALGYGAVFMVRELVRQKLLTSEHVIPYCYVPQAVTRRFLEELGCVSLANVSRSERSVKIHEFLQENIEDPTFEGDFDIPLLLAAQDRDLKQKVLGMDDLDDLSEEEEEYEW